MKFTDYTSYLYESEKIPKEGRLESEYGFFDYYYHISPEWPNGVVVGLGGYVYKEFRGQGKYKELLKDFLSSVPEGTTAQFAVASKHLIPMFKRLGFKKVKRIEYWGEAQHLFQAVITKELIDAI